MDWLDPVISVPLDVGNIIEIITELDAQPGYHSGTLVIDLKPKQEKMFLYEVMGVWGCSEYDWTPILLRLNGLFVDESPEKSDSGNEKFAPLNQGTKAATSGVVCLQLTLSRTQSM